MNRNTIFLRREVLPLAHHKGVPLHELSVRHVLCVSPPSITAPSTHSYATTVPTGAYPDEVGLAVTCDSGAAVPIGHAMEEDDNH